MKRTRTKEEVKEPIDIEMKLILLTQAHRLREDFMRTRVKLSLQIEASKRRIRNNPVDEAFNPARHYEDLLATKLFDTPEKEYGKEMIRIVKEVPTYDWFCSIQGCSGLGLAMILAETGNLSNYSNPAKVWKRMGLSVHDGEADKNRTKGINTGYNKRRRMIVYRVGSSIVKTGTEYRQIYLDRKAYEQERDAEGYNSEYIEKNKLFMLKVYASKANQDLIKAGRLPACVIDLRAQRYMTKRLIKNLWIQWNEEV